MGKPMEIYDEPEHRFISGEFRPVRELDTGAQLGYFESLECATTLAILVLYPDGTYFFVERLGRMAAESGDEPRGRR